MKGSTIKTKPVAQFLTAVGLTASFSLPVLAEEINLNNAPASMLSMPARGQADSQREMRDEGEKMSPEERIQRRQAMREHWNKMSPEEREQMRKKMKERWKNMPPEEREKRRQKMREHFKNMSPEERQQFKRDMGQNAMPLPE